MAKIRLTQDCEHGAAGTVLEVDAERVQAFLDEGRCELEVENIEGIGFTDETEGTFTAPEEPEDKPEPEPEPAKPKAPKGRAKKGHRR